MDRTATVEEDPGRTSRVSARAVAARWQQTWLSPSSPAPTWIGVSLTALGFVLIAYAWGRVAGLAAVPLQVPYIVSAGFTGLGLICVGIGVIAVQAKRQETAVRERQLAEIRDLVDRLDRHVRGDDEPAPDGRRPASGPHR